MRLLQIPVRPASILDYVNGQEVGSHRHRADSAGLASGEFEFYPKPAVPRPGKRQPSLTRYGTSAIPTKTVHSGD